MIAVAQEVKTSSDTIPFYRMSLEELMNVTVTVASHLPMTNRESPGIVTIYTGDEIRRSGARDLMQVLQQVPGFDFGVDVEGVVGIGIRGNWAHEGKVLMLWDGMEMNEDLYSTLQFGMHYPIDRIKQIEIIRGPGSAMYGGNAEYAVINVVTLNNKDFNGLSASAGYSLLDDNFGSRNAVISGGKTFGKTHINFATGFYEANRSTEVYSDYEGSEYDMSNQSQLKNSRHRMDFFFKGLTVSGMCDLYSVEQRDGYDVIYLRSYKSEFNSGFASAKYEIKPGANLVITPGIRIKYQNPWSYRKPVYDDLFQPFNTTAAKNEYYLHAVYDPAESVNLIGGFVYYNQHATEHLDSTFFKNGTREFRMDNYSGYLQSIIRLSALNFILGMRFDNNPVYGSSFVPRVGVTKVWHNFHFKTLYSRAFRAPSIENINVTPEIKPERTEVAELEAGIRIATNSYLTANVFDITTCGPIVYYYDDNMVDRYKNDISTGSRGIEVEYKLKNNRWYAGLNYAYFTTAGHPVISIYQTPSLPKKPLAFPSHKINVNGNYQLTKDLSINTSLVYMAKRYSYLQDTNGNVSAKEFNPVVYANLCLNIENIISDGFQIAIACNNLWDRKVLYIQPYNGNHAPLYGSGREIQLKLSYSLPGKAS